MNWWQASNLSHWGTWADCLAVQSFLFFATDEIEYVTHQMSKLSRLKARVPNLIHHLMGGGDIPVHTHLRAANQAMRLRMLALKMCVAVPMRTGRKGVPKTRIPLSLVGNSDPRHTLGIWVFCLSDPFQKIASGGSEACCIPDPAFCSR